MSDPTYTSQPRFTPRPGQVDYTRARRAPVINCVVEYEGEIILVQRGSRMKFYPNCWNGISGFLDDKRTVAEKARAELLEELGIRRKDIFSIRQGRVFRQRAPRYRKTWIVHPLHVKVVRKPKIRLNWEARAFRWVQVAEAKKLPLLPGFEKVLSSLFQTKA